MNDLEEQNRKKEWVERSVGMSLLLETLNSEQSRISYTRNIDFFRKFTDMDVDELLQLDPSELTKRIQMFIITLKKTRKPNTVKAMVAPIRSICDLNDVMLNWKKINRFLPKKVKLTGQSAWQTTDVKKMLDSTNKPYTRALIHVFCSTGARVGGVAGIRLKDITETDYGCRKVVIYPSDVEEYITFLTPEAGASVDEYLASRHGEELDEDSLLFGTKRKTNALFYDKHFGWHEQRTVTRRLPMRVTRAIEKAGLRGDKTGHRYNTQVCHGFRKRFNTILKENNEVNDNAIEKMMGHKNGLDGTYLQITDENLLKHFLKGVDDLTIDNSFRLKKKSEGLQDQLTKIREEVRESVKAEMEQQLSDIKYRQSKRLK